MNTEERLAAAAFDGYSKKRFGANRVKVQDLPETFKEAWAAAAYAAIEENNKINREIEEELERSGSIK